VDEADVPDFEVDVSKLRAILEDVHHGLHHHDVEGKANAAAHTVRRARQSGVPKDVADEMATEVFQRLIQEIPSGHKKRPWWWRKREPAPASEPVALRRGAERRALPPGE
jgi:hypothetical protein